MMIFWRFIVRLLRLSSFEINEKIWPLFKLRMSFEERSILRL